MKEVLQRLLLITGVIGINTAMAQAPKQEDVDVYSSLCKIGSLSKYDLGVDVGLIGRRIATGGARYSEQELKDEFPGIKDEKNRLTALQAYQDCMYRYVERFHPPSVSNATSPDLASNILVAPSVSLERKREIIFLANELENFKVQMLKMKAKLPEKYYDKRDSKEKQPKEDTRIVDLDNYNRYKAFQTANGVPDFSNISNSDIVILCDTFGNEAGAYHQFTRDFGRVLELTPYQISSEVSRICQAAKKGR